MAEGVAKTRHRCAGCERVLSLGRPWCAPCGSRLPADIAQQVQHTERAYSEAVAAARLWLRRHPSCTERDIEILALVAEGHDTVTVATKLGITPQTVKDHLRRLSVRWGCKGRAHLIGQAYQLGYLKIRNGGTT